MHLENKLEIDIFKPNLAFHCVGARGGGGGGGGGAGLIRGVYTSDTCIGFLIK